MVCQTIPNTRQTKFQSSSKSPHPEIHKSHKNKLWNSGAMSLWSRQMQFANVWMLGFVKLSFFNFRTFGFWDMWFLELCLLGHFSLSLCLSLSLSLSLSLCLSLYVYIDLYISIYTYISLNLYMYVSIHFGPSTKKLLKLGCCGLCSSHNSLAQLVQSGSWCLDRGPAGGIPAKRSKAGSPLPCKLAGGLELQLLWCHSSSTFQLLEAPVPHSLFHEWAEEGGRNNKIAHPLPAQRSMHLFPGQAGKTARTSVIRWMMRLFLSLCLFLLFLLDLQVHLLLQLLPGLEWGNFLAG